jgi:hypothetical protein
MFIPPRLNDTVIIGTDTNGNVIHQFFRIKSGLPNVLVLRWDHDPSCMTFIVNGSSPVVLVQAVVQYYIVLKPRLYLFPHWFKSRIFGHALVESFVRSILGSANNLHRII